MSDDRIELPSYLDHVPEVAAYFDEIDKRKVVLSIEHLYREFDSPDSPSGKLVALSDINFKVRRNEFISVIGPSGCGKSTLIRVVAGLEDPSGGIVAVDGIAVTGPGADRGMVFQNYTLFPWLTVRKNVLFGPKMKGLRNDKATKAADEWLKLVGLTDFADLYPAQLSGGMKQRVAIARALANDPRILLMDEPFGALDAQTRASMQAHLLRIWAAAGVTILFITHDLDEAIYLSDRIVVLGARPGRILEVIDVPVARPRGPEQFLSGHFLATKKRLEDLIHRRDQASDTSGSSATSATSATSDSPDAGDLMHV